jgi:hypothetical protein
MEDFDNRKCYCIVDIGDGHNTLACRKRITGETYKVNEYEMTEDPLVDFVFVRWATGFDV